ncbi:MAG: hypothetical protein ACI9C4_001624 [Paraglaciecola sp.]|jgi:hypothetical protein
MQIIVSLLAFIGAFTSNHAAASASDNLRVTAVVLPVCRLDNTSINFAERNAINEVGVQAVSPLSVTCNDRVSNGTHLLILAKSKTLNNSAILDGTGPAGHSAATIYYQ